MSLVDIQGLSICIGSRIQAVRNVDLSIERGTIHGLIGESGCGKTITGMAMLGLLPEISKISAMRFHFDGIDMTAAAQELRGRRISMISQDPAASLNPVLTIGKQMDDVLRYASPASKAERRNQSIELLAAAGLSDPESIITSYTHQLSGGMQQRVVIAQALATGAEFLIADEPTTALDATVEKQVLQQLQKLVAERGLTVLMITHDMSVIRRICSRTSLLYAGTTIEEGPTDVLLNSPCHPYAKGLLAALPSAAPPRHQLATIHGSVPSATSAIEGCAFAARCPQALDHCASVSPPHHVQKNHNWRCHLEADDG